MKQDVTISAVSTAVGEAGIGIIRMSGAKSIEIGDKIFRAANGKSLSTQDDRRAIFGRIIDSDGRSIDEVIALVMRSPHSYTMEDVVEFQCHGGSMVLRKILSRTYEAGARPADRGEFTKRAFLNGRIDLSQAQAVMDIIQAKTDSALKVAEGKLSGAMSDEISRLRKEILDATAHIEAVIDFPEEDIDDVELGKVDRSLSEVIERLDVMLKNEHVGRILREGMMTAIIGKPNVGKSSLLNALLQMDRAIVTDIPGTTRDAIEEYADIDGVPLKIVDTAGIRNSGDVVEQIGIDRAKEHAAKAELILALFDGSNDLTDEDAAIFDLISDHKAIILITKSDLSQKISVDDIQRRFPSVKVIAISVKTPRGIDELRRAIVDMAGLNDKSDVDLNFVRDAREADAVRRAKKHLEDARSTIKYNVGIDFVSIDLRAALEAIGELTGETVTDDIINEIFSTFCIGK